MKRILFIMIMFTSILSMISIVNAEDSTETFYTGLEIMSDEELEAFHNTLPKIVDIKPNRIALSRFSDEESVLFENIEIAEFGEEKVYATSNDIDILSLEETEFLLTEAVDVSESLTFPPVGDQDQILACIPWAMCYYQLTNNHCVVNGLHSKTETGDAIPENIMAPGFIYSLCNGGVNASTHIVDVTEALVGYGCPNIDAYNLQITEESLRKWCTDTNVWYDAMYNKPQQITHIPIDTKQIVNKDSKCVELIKRELANGYVLTFGTRAKDFELTTNITSNLDNTGITEYGCKFRNNSNLADQHFMTIVGYDDTFWIDVNDNGQEDEGEFGAFKIMNSAGQRVTEYMTGYIWMSYDSLGETSGVDNAPANRYPAMESAVYCIEAQKNYIPLLVAEVEITTAKRNDIIVQLGISSVDYNEPEYFISPFPNETIDTGAFNNAANGECTGRLNINFSGEISEECAIIPFDLTSAIKYAYEYGENAIGSEIRCFIRIIDGDGGDEDSILLGAVTVVEPMTERQFVCSNNATIIAGDTGANKYVDFNITPFMLWNNKQDINITFNSNIQTSSITENIYFITPEGKIKYPECEANDNEILIKPPGARYEPDSKYELHIKPSLQSLGGNSLSNEIIILIYMLGDLPYNEVSWIQ